MKNPKKWDYINDFKLTADGKYTYMGDYYSPEGDRSYKQVYIQYIFIACICTALVIASGLINAAGMNNTFYVILPYVAQVCSVFALVWKTIRVVSSGEKVKAYVYETAVVRLTPALMSLFVCSLITFFASLLFIILNGTENKTILCISYLILQAVTAAVSFTSRLYCRKIKWVKI